MVTWLDGYPAYDIHMRKPSLDSRLDGSGAILIFCTPSSTTDTRGNALTTFPYRWKHAVSYPVCPSFRLRNAKWRAWWKWYSVENGEANRCGFEDSASGRSVGIRAPIRFTAARMSVLRESSGEGECLAKFSKT